MTEPKKQDGTMELDVGQIDLLDLPLPPRSKPNMESAAPAEEHRVSKGPPPLPPSAPPPSNAGAPPADEEPPVPSLALPSPSQPHPPPAGAISARSLAFGPPQKQKSPAVQLAIGMGGATLVCVIAFFAWKLTHKTQPVTPAASASAAPVATQAFTMAPIEFTSPVTSGSAAPEETAAPSAHASSSSAPATTTTKPSGTSRGTATPAGTTKPPRTDELIKVEN